MDIFSFLEENKITYDRCDHPPVFTCEEASRLVPKLPGRKSKNLFICDNKGKQHFLVTLADDKSVDLKQLAPMLGLKKIRFASPKRLQKYLKLDPGSVTILAAVNDENHDVGIVVDQEVWASDALLCHPLINTSTLVIKLNDIKKFLDATGHEPLVIDIPSRELK